MELGADAQDLLGIFHLVFGFPLAPLFRLSQPLWRILLFAEMNMVKNRFYHFSEYLFFFLFFLLLVLKGIDFTTGNMFDIFPRHLRKWRVRSRCLVICGFASWTLIVSGSSPTNEPIVALLGRG